MELNDTQFERYARHLILDEVGEDGQEKLLDARVLVIGAGGLGSPMILYLAAAGVGTIGVVDDDVVDLSNLQRQVIHATERVGTSKVESVAATVSAVNPDVRIVRHPQRIGPGNVEAIIKDYDVVADGSDNFPTRYLMNDACYLARTPLISAALLRFEGQMFRFERDDVAHPPCYRCVFPEAPDPSLVPRCEQAGILGSICGVMGSLQATEVLKALVGLGDSLRGHMLIYDALGAEFRRIRLAWDPACRLCGEGAQAASLADMGWQM